MRRLRRKHPEAFKPKVSLAVLKGFKTPVEKFDVHSRQVTQWRAQLMDGAIGLFLTPSEKHGSDQVPSAEEMQAQTRQLIQEEPFVRSRARSRGRCERKAMIVKTPPLSVKQQAELLAILRANVCYLPTPTPASDLATRRRGRRRGTCSFVWRGLVDSRVE